MSAETHIRGGSLQILVVDDDDAVLWSACGRLLSYGYEIRTLAQAQSLLLLQTIDHLRPDLVLLDALIPALDSHQLAALLARYSASGSPAVILHSAVPIETLCSLFDARDAFGVIQKTTDHVEFFRAFDALLDRFHSRKASFDRPSGYAASGTHPIGEGTERVLNPGSFAFPTGDVPRASSRD